MSGQALDAFRRLGLRAPGGRRCEACAVHRPEASAGYEAACLTQALNSDVRGRTIAFLGGAFKAGTSDDRDSPALRVADRLHQLGAIVRLFDPEAQDNARRTHPHLAFADSALDATHEADLVVIATEWPAFNADPKLPTAAEHVTTRTVVDVRNALDAGPWLAGCWTVHQLGRPARTPTA